MKILEDAYSDACRRHPHFPGDLSAIGTILAEELLEVNVAGMKALQAINDHLDEGALLENVKTELTHVITVARRALNELEGRSQC